MDQFTQIFKVMLDAGLHLLDRIGFSRKPLTCAHPVIPGFTLWRTM